MSKLTKEQARKLLNLNSNGLIDKDIAERQFEVIVKGFNYLNQPENKFLYIADEVGLGKTYIALGIASLLRYFSNNKTLSSYKDTIILPKKNLQTKWQKEIKNFINNNWQVEHNRVKSIFGKSIAKIGDDQLFQHIQTSSDTAPCYELYRMTSFSMTRQKKGWNKKLRNLLNNNESIEILNKALKQFRGQKSIPVIKRLFAYLVNIQITKSNLVIVDEAHNYRHGIDIDTSARNQVLSSIMGVTNNDKIDKKIFKLFSKSKIQAKADKVIFLSATPINSNCYELKNQFDVFLPSHPYKETTDFLKTNKKIKDDLGNFMIRGLMSITLSEKQYSRNQYRHEHRKGNVDKIEPGEHQSITDPFTQALLSLFQFKTREILNTKNHGGSFEMGMLAGFESFDIHDEDDQNDIDELNHRNEKEGGDEEFIRTLVHSYQKEFKEPLKHPKQDTLVEILFQKMLKQEKSLVFVRRIKTIDGIVDKLVDRYEDEMYSRVNKPDLKKLEDIKHMLGQYKKRKNRTTYLKYLDRIAEELWKKHGHKTWNNERDEQTLQEFHDDDYNALDYIKRKLGSILDSKNHQNPKVQELKESIELKMSNRNYSHPITLKAWRVLESSTINNLEVDQIADNEESNSNQRYFFLDYFGSNYSKGKAFKSLISKQDWYRFNYYFLLEEFDQGVLVNQLETEYKEISNTKEKSNQQDIKNKLIVQFLHESELNKNVPNTFKNKTFLTILLTEVLKTEWINWKNKNGRRGFLKCIEDLKALTLIVQGIFRNGSGLLPSYIAYLASKEKKVSFERTLVNLLESDFKDTLQEIRTVVDDFDKIVATNFPDRDKISQSLYQQAPVMGASGKHNSGGISKLALQFRMPGFPYVLIATDILKEGEDLHSYCSDVYHYGIAWNPSDMEQRTGRIDRINSKTYYNLDRSDTLYFNNMLQVYFPYLSDTLEINQMHSLFSKMNDFVETFYDVSDTAEKDSKVSIEKQIFSLPAQNKKKLFSKFDHGSFVNYENEKEIALPQHIGETKENLLQSLEKFKRLLLKELHIVSPQIIDHTIEGVMEITENNKRRGPYTVSFTSSESLGQFQYKFQSKISSQIDHSTRDKIAKDIDSKFRLNTKNRALWLSTTCSLGTSKGEQLEQLKNLIFEADKLEEHYTSQDEE